MRKIMLIAATGCALVMGCQTRITAEKYAEVPNPIQQVVTVNGEDKLVTTGYLVTSGGWYATARSPLYAAEALTGLDIGVHTNGSVTLAIEKYNRDVSTNAVAMVETVFVGSTNLVTAIGAAYAKIAGGAASDTVTSVASKVVSYFTDKGGNADAATVTTSGSTMTVTDGTTTVVCDADGNCTDCKIK